MEELLINYCKRNYKGSELGYAMHILLDFLEYVFSEECEKDYKELTGKELGK